MQHRGTPGRLLTLSVAITLASLIPAQDREPGVPKDVRGFSGQVTGTVTARHDDGTFSFRVALVTRVWQDNKASNLEWFLGRTLRVGPRWVQGDDGKWHRAELHVRFIEKLRDKSDHRLEIRHAERDRFAILELNESQRQVAKAGSDAGAQDPPRLPATLRGFSGQVAGIVRSKHDNGTFTFHVARVQNVWKDNEAEKPESLVGQTIRIGPRWVKGDDGKWRPDRIHAQFIGRLEDGEDYRVEIHNVEGDHFNILELSQEQREWARRGRH